MKRVLSLFLIVIALASCTSRTSSVSEQDEAQLFRIEEVRRAEPLTRLAVTSATHIGFLQALGRTDVIVAMTNPDLVYNQPQQEVANIGEDINILLEPLLQAKPQALLITDYGQPIANLDRIEAAGIEVIKMAEWHEQTPLARADWIRFMGVLIGEEKKADSIIASVREQYHRIATRPAEHTSILSGASFRGTWYVPSGGTYMGCLFRDAGADYPYYDDLRQASIPMTFEAVLLQFGKAEVWVGCNTRTYSELLALDDHHAWFTAYQNRQVYNWYKQTTPTGANNFWERGIVHPEEILEDLITILHKPDPEQAQSLHYAAPLTD